MTRCRGAIAHAAAVVEQAKQMGDFARSRRIWPPCWPRCGLCGPILHLLTTYTQTLPILRVLDCSSSPRFPVRRARLLLGFVGPRAALSRRPRSRLRLARVCVDSSRMAPDARELRLSACLCPENELAEWCAPPSLVCQRSRR